MLMAAAGLYRGYTQKSPVDFLGGFNFLWNTPVEDLLRQGPFTQKSERS